MNRRLDTVEAAAAAWDARLRGAGASFRDRRAFHAWLREDPEHQAAHDRLQATLSMLRAHAKLPELSALRDEARNGVRESRRRRVASVVSAAVAAIVLLVLGIAVQTRPAAEIAAVPRGDTIHTTSLDERSKVTLADGSVVTLDSGTRLSARLGSARRDITLLAGRALFQVARDRRRPFVVKAGDRTITALGTVFDVRLSPRELRVTLAEGTVAVRPIRPRGGSAPQILQPRQQFVAIAGTGAGTAALELRTVDTDKELSWTDGQVFFENEPLAGAVAEMNRYSRRKIVVDPAVADLRINGMFRTSSQAGFADALEVALPVEVREDGGGGLLVVGRSDRVGR